MSKVLKPQGIAIRYSNTINDKVVDTIKEHNEFTRVLIPFYFRYLYFPEE